MKVKLEIIDNNSTQVLEGGGLVDKLLSYTVEYFVKTTFRSERRTAKKSYYSKGFMPTGFIGRVEKHCSDNDIVIEVSSWEDKLDVGTPALKGITFREDQKELIKTALERQRGVLVAPTGTGKTIVTLGILSALQGVKCVLLFPTSGLVKQTTAELKKFGFDVKNKLDESNADILACTRQYLIKNYDKSDFWGLSDCVIVDECHLGFGSSGDYATLFKNTDAPMRIGLTATPTNKEEHSMTLEAHVGPVIAETKHNDASDLDLLETPYVDLIAVTRYPETDARSYHDIYSDCIIENTYRNELIVKKTDQLVSEGLSVLIATKNIRHIDLLKSMLDKRGVDCVVVDGSDSEDSREQIRQDMINGKLKCCISSVVFREGVNIPTLNAVVFAAGGKSESGVVQFAGRALRKHPDKKEAVIVDIIDNYRYLSEHTCARLSVYIKLGWL